MVVWKGGKGGKVVLEISVRPAAKLQQLTLTAELEI